MPKLTRYINQSCFRSFKPIYTAILAAELKPTNAKLLLKLLQKMKQNVVMSIISVIINATVN